MRAGARNTSVRARRRARSRKYTKCKGIACQSARRKGEFPLNPPVVKRMVSAPPKPPQKATRSTPKTIRSWRILIQNAFCDLRGQAPYSLPPDNSGGTSQTGYVFRFGKAERNFLPLRSIFGGWTLNRAQPPKTDLRDFQTFRSGA